MSSNRSKASVFAVDESLLHCFVCKQIYREPKSLFCSHVLCSLCAASLSPATCPVCETHFALPLQDAPLVQTLVEQYRQQMEQKEEEEDSKKAKRESGERSLDDGASASRGSLSFTIFLIITLYFNY